MLLEVSLGVQAASLDQILSWRVSPSHWMVHSHVSYFQVNGNYVK